LAEVLTWYEAFWFEHDVSGVPNHLFARIGSLRDSTLVADEHEQVLSGVEAFVRLIEDSDLIKIITPFYSTDFIDRLVVFASKDKEWHIIVTEEVLQCAIIDAEHPNVKGILEGEGQIYVIRQDPKLFFVSTGRAIALALSTIGGQLDYSTLLVSRGRDAITWGKELFRYYEERSEKVVLH
jgi:predicted transcriptional regulator